MQQIDLKLGASKRFRDDASRFKAFQERDYASDGCFIVAVKTTGIYCRPVCPARPPKRENIIFYDDIATARRAGFRSCKRCLPDEQSHRQRLAQAISAACEKLERAEQIPTVSELARALDISAGQFHRVFKNALGMTPRQYALASRVKSMQNDLMKGRAVTSALYSAGFNSASRGYAALKRVGAKPSAFKTGGQGLLLRVGIARCSLGHVAIAMSPSGLCSLTFGDTAEEAQRSAVRKFPKANYQLSTEALREELETVVHLIEDPSVMPELPLDIRGTAFQEKVWKALKRIPVGETCSYSQLAKQIGRPTAARAVAQACGANKIAVLIPCHRVIAHDGSLGGYAFGERRKTALLKKEAKLLK